MPRSTRWNRLRRLLVCLGVGAVAPLGSINVGSYAAAAVVGIALAVIAWIVWGLLDERDDDEA